LSADGLAGGVGDERALVVQGLDQGDRARRALAPRYRQDEENPAYAESVEAYGA
jgi:hypothetical protein